MNKEDIQYEIDYRVGLLKLRLDDELKGLDCNKLIVFDCPNCGHKTVAVKERRKVVLELQGFEEPFCLERFSRPNMRCLVCGKLFSPEATETYEEVK